MSYDSGRDILQETNGDPEAMIDEATEVLVVESGPEWRVMIEHTGSDNLIQITCGTHADAVAIIDRIQTALEQGENRIRLDPGHLVSLNALRQVWIDDSRSEPLTAVDPYN